ncbi:hypothetical protein [Paenibacillus gansuensis]|uniref:Uncharacterized protein n=1 Tax=Paenibacillus gansuensis TaxID=306542 RepID=A0ABW5PIQ0_9BACL
MAAGFAAGFEGAMGTVMRQKGLKSEGVTIVSNCALGKDANDGYVLIKFALMLKQLVATSK